MDTLGPRHTGTQSPDGRQLPRWSSVHITRKPSRRSPTPPPSQKLTFDYNTGNNDEFDFIDLDSEKDPSVVTEYGDAWHEACRNLSAMGLSFGVDISPIPLVAPPHRFSLVDSEPADGENNTPTHRGPFEKWMRTLHRRAANNRRQTVSGSIDSGFLELPGFRENEPRDFIKSRHKKSSSSSSLSFVTAVKSASISLASFSIAPLSRRTGVSSRHQNRSSRASNTGNRISEDSSYAAGGGLIDEAVIKRLIQRRKVLEEIISTEESYVADIKFLMNVYVTLLASMPTLSLNMRSSISSNLNEIVDLHEELLGDLHRIVPQSEYTQADICPSKPPQLTRIHRRWQSLDAVLENKSGMSCLQKVPGLTADANVAAEVARSFGQRMHRFFVYEEYGAKYEMMIKDVSVSYKTIPQWDTYQKGLEALGKSLASHNNQSDHLKKAMTVGDLMVKPIQRVCRYPLLFAELLKQTPVYDCPDSHAEIGKVLLRMREATMAINRATSDPQVKVTMEKTWLLQDRLDFPEQTETNSKNALRALGHVQLCGVLHVAWQTRDGVDGQHMICILYKDFLVLASAGKADHMYSIQVCIKLGEVRVEEADNGRGLQCHTAPYSWKLVFEYDHQLYEIIFSACTPKEGLEWRTRMNDYGYKEQMEDLEIAFFATMSLGITPLGTVFGKPGTIARRLSIHRATTVGPKSSLCQVIIKNTSAMKDVSLSAYSTSINRSQSLLTTNRIPILVSSRADRVRLENLISDVWTRDILPFPGMTGRSRGEHLVRTSASSMIRKLSVASITSNFTKRSVSQPSLAARHHLVGEDFESIDTRGPSSTDYENTLRDKPEAGSAFDSEDTIHVRVSAMEDENVHYPTVTTDISHSNGRNSPVRAMRRLATLRTHKLDGCRHITPPLRTSSANSIRVSRTLSGPPSGVEKIYDAQEKENHHEPKQNRWTKATGGTKGLSTEGLRSFFR